MKNLSLPTWLETNTALAGRGLKIFANMSKQHPSLNVRIGKLLHSQSSIEHTLTQFEKHKSNTVTDCLDVTSSVVLEDLKVWLTGVYLD